MRSLKPPGGFGRGRFLVSGFTPKSALPIIAPLCRGPTGGFARERLPAERSSRLLKGPRWGLFHFKRGGRWSPFLFLSFVRRRFTRMRDALMRLLEPPIEALDYELVDIE